MLLSGMVFLCFTVATRAAKLETAAGCPDAHFSLQGRGAITSVAPQGDKVQITLAGKAQTQVLTVDRCSGRLLQTLTIAP